MKTLIKILGLLWISHTVYGGVIYGVPQIHDKYRQVHYPAYVQIGSFSSVHAAKQARYQLQKKTKIPVIIQSTKGRYKVVVGPFQNTYALKAFALKTAPVKKSIPTQIIPHTDVLPILSSIVAPIPVLDAISEEITEKPVPSKWSSRLAHVLPPGLHPEWSFMLGGTYVPNAIGGQTLQLLPYEIGQYADTFTHQSNATAFTWGLDGRYRYRLHEVPTDDYVIHSVSAGIQLFQITNFYQIGKVLQFNMPEFENYTYKLHVNDIRLMADADLEFHPIYEQLFPFVEVGIGAARTAVSYDSAPIAPVEGPNFSLPTEASWNFAYQAGAGLKYAIKKHYRVSFRYLYANMGTANSSTNGSSTDLATPLKINLSTHNFLLGLSYLME